jgi:tetratricopeptide (TPR) repeat protein
MDRTKLAPIALVLGLLAPSAAAAEPYRFHSPPFMLTEGARGAFDGAKGEYDKDPKNPRAVAAYVTSLKIRGQIGEAIKVAEACKEQGCKFLLGVMLSETDRAAETEAILRPFVGDATGKDKATTYILLGKAGLARGDAAAAIKDFRAAVAVEPSARVAKLWESYALVYTGKHADALKLLDGELATMTSGEVMLFRARAYAALGRAAEAKKAMQAAYDGLINDVMTAPDVSFQHLYLAAAAEGVGRKDVAAVHRDLAKQLLVTREIYAKK